MSRAASGGPAGDAAIASWGFIILLGFASGLSTFGMASVVPALPEIGRALGAGAAQLQFVISGYLLGLGLFQPIQGLLCDRFGRRPVLLTGFAIFIAASLLASTTHSLAALAGARTLQALGVSVATVISRAMVRDTHAPHAAAIALSFITAVMGVVPILAPLAGGIVVDQAGWPALFLMHAAMGALLLVWMVFSLRETRPQETQVMTLRSLLRGFAALLREPVFLAHTLTYGFVSGSTFMFLTMGASLFANLFGMTPSRFGVFWATLASGYMLGALAAGWSARRFGAKRVIAVATQLGIVAALATVATALFAPGRLWLWTASLMLLIFSSGLSSPLSLASAVSQRADLAGVASGLSSSLAMLLSMLCAVISGLVYHGDPMPNLVLLVGCCVGAWICGRAAFPRAAAQDEQR